ncbi:hypothetical protein YPPY64_1094, partial [Yersinia pestis PY-64]
MRQRPCVTL